MNRDNFWKLFRETGRPEFYILYREAGRETILRQGTDLLKTEDLKLKNE